MAERDRLIFMLIETFDEQYNARQMITSQHTADHLLANGVIVPPCKVGDYVHFKGLEEPWIVSTINFYAEGEPQISITSNTGKVTTTMTFSEFSGFAVVLTREEAEKALEERRMI